MTEKEIDNLQFEIDQLINKCLILNKDELTATARVLFGRNISFMFMKILNENEHYKSLTEQKDKEIQELKKYDIRNIKMNKDKIISSPSFTRKEVDLMNLGIALSLNADKLFNDESEEDDI